MVYGTYHRSRSTPQYYDHEVLLTDISGVLFSLLLAAAIIAYQILTKYQPAVNESHGAEWGPWDHLCIFSVGTMFNGIHCAA
jgi:hypothetical protein